MPVELKEVTSSNIAKLGYDKETQTLRVKFIGGALWDYSPVPEEEYLAVAEARSVGKEFAARIRAFSVGVAPKYVAVRVEAELLQELSGSHTA